MSCTKQQRLSQLAYCFTQSVSFQQFCGVNKGCKNLSVVKTHKLVNPQNVRFFTKLCSTFQRTLLICSATLSAVILRDLVQILSTASRNAWFCSYSYVHVSAYLHRRRNGPEYTCRVHCRESVLQDNSRPRLVALDCWRSPAVAQDRHWCCSVSTWSQKCNAPPCHQQVPPENQINCLPAVINDITHS